jgi:hypothetical protein
VQNIDESAYDNIPINNELGYPLNNGLPVGFTGAGGGQSIPPSNASILGNFNVYLSSDDDAEYFEGGKTLGFGKSQYVSYNPVTTFGNERTYIANIDGKVAKNYFKIFVNRDVRGYNQQTSKPTFYEYINISEYRLKPNSQTEYEFYEYKNLDTVFGTVEIRFLFEPKIVTPIEPDNDKPIDVLPTKSYDFGISVKSNYLIELGDLFSLDYKIANSGNDILKGNIPLKNENTDKLSISEDNINSSNIILTLIGELPTYFTFENIKIGNYTSVDRTITIPASIIKTGNINVDLLFGKNIPQPIVDTNDTKYTAQVKDTDSDKSIEIPISLKNAKSINVTFPNGNVKNITDTSFVVSFKKDFAGSYSLQKIILTPIMDTLIGASKEILIQFERIDNTPQISNVTYPISIDIPTFSDYNIEYEVQYESTFATSVKVELLQKDNTKILYLDKLTPVGSFKVNIKNLKDNYKNWDGDITFIFTAINAGGDVVLESNTNTYRTQILYPTIKLDEDLINTSLFNAFINQINIPDLDKDSKYLTHLANFGDDNEFLISSWENDDWTLSKKSIDELGNEFVKPADVVESLILKLYKPLSPNITNNSTLWITKLLTNPLIETIVLNEQDDIKCPPLKGPNFNVEVDFVTGKSTGYESLDDLILSGSTSSTKLITKYLSGSLMDTTDLNIEYSSGSTYLWENFVHFSSAKERVDNFVYKIRLIELYENLILSASTDVANPSSLSIPSSYTSSFASHQEVERQTIKKNQIIESFDGFEAFLYTPSSYTNNDSSSITWPHNGQVRLNSTDINVQNWYSDIVTLAEDYDIENPNWINNNIPQYIVNNDENASLLLFFSMIGQHFDNIYFHTKAIEKSRGLGYKQSGNISDKLLFDILKSQSWDAKNLAADNHLWSLVFGVDVEGNEINTNPAKKRNNEVWRRIVNNLPYLLKHKGTRQGIYALMACYGIPSSNLSILEFGGPEVTEEGKGKLLIDNITTALKFNTDASLTMDWKNTNKGTKPNTIELFVKPAYSSEWQIIDGMGWNVKLSGSINDEYGKVIFNYSGSNNFITSSLLPIFNDRFFGISVSSGSNGLKLDVRQCEKGRTIFAESITGSGFTNWNNGNTITIGSVDSGSYSGSLDEFRIWSEVLDTQKFYDHVSFPEMVNGNSVSSSIDDLYLRLDFEYPKNLTETSSLFNIATNIYYSEGLVRNDYEKDSTIAPIHSTISASIYVSASGFDSSLTSYPFQFEPIDRTVVMAYPDGGASRFQTQKVRFESQTLVSDLSSKHRSTKKAFDQSPTDSNRVGLFFSPTKELNIDIAKSFGGLNIDNYIGDPSDDYKPNYSQLDSLRHYYFQRFNNRNIYEYINLIKLYEKSMFEDIKKMLPARVKATTGLLIEPHFLERSKVAHKKPSGDDYQLDTEIKYSDTTITSAENNQFETIVNANLSENLFAENNQFESLISTQDTQKTMAENYQYTASYAYIADTNAFAENYQEEVTIDAKLAEPSILAEIDLGIETYGQTAYEEIGFGLYGDNGYAIRTYIDVDGITKKERVKVDVIKEQKRRDVFAPIIKIDGKGDPRGGYYLTSSIYYETKLNIQQFSGSKVINTGTGSIVEVKPLAGYLPTHYRNTSDLTTGMMNSYYKGSKNTAATTLDGTPPIEVFSSNPNTLKVNKSGRTSNEPILEVE